MSRIDLRSDTVTHPSPAMRRAMAEAEERGFAATVRPLVARVRGLVSRPAAF